MRQLRRLRGRFKTQQNEAATQFEAMKDIIKLHYFIVCLICSNRVRTHPPPVMVMVAVVGLMDDEFVVIVSNPMVFARDSTNRYRS